MRRLLLTPFLLALATPGIAQSFTRQPDGITVTLPGQTLRIQVISDTVLHIAAKPAGAPSHPSITVVAQPATAGWTAEATPAGIAVATPRVRALIDPATGRVRSSMPSPALPFWLKATAPCPPQRSRESTPGTSGNSGNRSPTKASSAWASSSSASWT